MKSELKSIMLFIVFSVALSCQRHNNKYFKGVLYNKSDFKTLTAGYVLEMTL